MLGGSRRGPWRRTLAGATAFCCALLALGVAGPSPADAAAGAHIASTSASHGSADGWWYDAMHLAAAQKQTKGQGVTIGLVDGAIDPDTPELRGADISVHKACYGDSSIHRNSLDSDHGSSMAAYLVGTGHRPDGKPGILGVAPKAKVLFYGLDDPHSRKGEAPFMECDGSEIGQQILKAARAGADIISISITDYDSSQNKKIISKVLRMGVVIVAATGDMSDPNKFARYLGFPAGYAGVVAVNAADRNARPWKFNPPPSRDSSMPGHLSFPVITAPGVHVAGTQFYPGHGWYSGVDTTGTSPATAIVAGSLALVKSKYPQATGNQLIQHLIHFTGGTAPYGWDGKYGFGIVSVKKMLAHDPTKWPDVNPLLVGAKAAVKKYPMSIYGRSSSPSASPASQKASSSTKASSSDGRASDDSHKHAAPAGSAGFPVWLWPVLVVVIAGLLVGALVTARRRGSRGAATETRAREG